MCFYEKLVLFGVLVCLFAACAKDRIEEEKVAEIVYYNLADDIIDRIELRLNGSGSTSFITLNKDIVSGDSLDFRFNTENFGSTSGYVTIFTSVYFKNSPTINNQMVNNEQISGVLTGKETTIGLLYIGNEKMLFCERRKGGFSNAGALDLECDLDSIFQ
ncbi:hypothetical protein LAG90_06900 [Marinilongibacter aquaticus]|uniref:hypothetical protein n=1 Tax=Marinilongibacter aquaticus TaxID=2975157 RepID=UPI0021BD3E78|nr:hypothetical protein [Marinilongibacter aquaticus]UBM60372.1 hypothetical protein LAG90_06900 [Marinilongibacter aquaticus]